jgi:hypothetical protein
LPCRAQPDNSASSDGGDAAGATPGRAACITAATGEQPAADRFSGEPFHGKARSDMTSTSIHRRSARLAALAAADAGRRRR